MGAAMRLGVAALLAATVAPAAGFEPFRAIRSPQLERLQQVVAANLRAKDGPHAQFRHMRLDEPAAPSDLLVQGRPPEPQERPMELQEIASLEYQQAQSTWKLNNLMGAIRLFLRSAQKGHEVGEYCFRWGQYHELPPQDIKQAIRWYARGVRMNHKSCTTMLGRLHIALGKKDVAKQLLARSATPEGLGQGDSLAQWFLAELDNSAGKLRSAVRWWKRSAENGDVDAMMRLAKIFTQGDIGIPQETARARHWLLAAAAHGHQEALGQIHLDMSGSDVVRPKVETMWIRHMEEQGWF